MFQVHAGTICLPLQVALSCGHGTPFPHDLTGRNLPTIQQQSFAVSQPKPSTVNEKTVADFTRVVDETGILDRERCALGPV